MVPNIEVTSQNAVLAAGFHPAAILLSCRVQHFGSNLNKTTSEFSAKIKHISPFWFHKASKLILDMKGSYWVWDIVGFQKHGDNIEGVISGDPEVVTSIPVSLRHGNG